MSNQERFAGKSHFTTSAKAVSIVITAAFVALLVSRTPSHLAEEPLVPAAAAVEQSYVQPGNPGWTPSTEQQHEAAARAAKQDDPPISSF